MFYPIAAPLDSNILVSLHLLVTRLRLTLQLLVPHKLIFLVNSGATHHITNDLANMAIRYPYMGPDSLFMGNGSCLNISL